MARDQLRAPPQALPLSLRADHRGGRSSCLASQGSHAQSERCGRAEVPRRQKEVLWGMKPEGARGGGTSCDGDPLRGWPAEPCPCRDRPCSRIWRGSCILKGRRLTGHPAAGLLLCQGREESARHKSGGVNELGTAAHRTPSLEDQHPPCPLQVLSFRLVSMVRSRGAQPVGWGACAAPRRTGRLHIGGRASGEPVGRWTAPAGRSWVRRAVRPGGGSSRGAARWRLAAGRRGGGMSAKSGRPTSTPPPLEAEWFGPRGMRCSAQRIEAGGMNHPTWGRGGPCPAAPPCQAAARASQRTAPRRGRGGEWWRLSAPEPARRHLRPGRAEGSGARRRDRGASPPAAASPKREARPGAPHGGVSGQRAGCAPASRKPAGQGGRGSSLKALVSPSWLLISLGSHGLAQKFRKYFLFASLGGAFIHDERWGLGFFRCVCWYISCIYCRLLFGPLSLSVGGHIYVHLLICLSIDRQERTRSWFSYKV